MVDDSGNSNLNRLAISAALKCEWNQALELNKRIIKLEPDNADCLNRLTKAYLELGKLSSAKRVCEEALKLDPYNSIAQKNLKKIMSFKKNGLKNHSYGEVNGHSTPLSVDLFLEEPGTTKVVSLIKVAEPQKLLTLSAGQLVSLVTKNKGVFVTDSNKQYLGVLPDDTGFHLRKLINGGNKYIAVIKSIKSNGLTILLKEVFRSKKFKNQASFLNEARVLSYSSENISIITRELEEAPMEEASEGEEIIH